MPHPRDAITVLLLLNTDRINLVMVICGILFYSSRRVVLSWATLFHALLVVDLIYQVLGWWHILTVGCHREQGHCFTRVSQGKAWSRIILLQRNVSWTDKWKHVIPENLISYNCKIALDDKRRFSDAREIKLSHCIPLTDYVIFPNSSVRISLTSMYTDTLSFIWQSDKRIVRELHSSSLGQVKPIGSLCTQPL